jgi:hypothetical protein
MTPMADDPRDPLTPPPFQYADVLQNGRMHHETLTRQTNYTHAAKVASAMTEDDLRHLALYIAAKDIADDCRHLGHLRHWQRWWRGIDGLHGDDEIANQVTPLQLWKQMEPHPNDDGTGTLHHPPAPE